jgi:4-alpha-glucanotransferase
MEPEEEVTLRLDWLINEPQPAGEVGDVCLIMSNDSYEEIVYPMDKLEESESTDVVHDHSARVRYQVKCRMPKDAQLMWYIFTVQKGEEVYTYGKKESKTSGEGAESKDRSALFPYQITVYEEKRKIPDWYKKGIVYQIFVDRFNRILDKHGEDGCNFMGKQKNSLLHLDWYDDPIYIRDPETNAVTHWDFFGGNLEGIIQKLAYLKTLGVSCLYLNPIFESPSNHKYDTGDYMKIDPKFGTEEIFKKLIDKAQKLGIHVILDGVFSHTGDDSRYFNRYGNYDTLGAYQSKDSPYYSWYRFQDYPNDYESWWDIWNMPNVNEMDPGYLDYIIKDDKSVLAHWMHAGISGWRLDVADELPDEFIAQFKERMIEKNPESILIGEVWEDATNKVSYGQRRKYFLGEELDSTMHYPFKDIVLGFLKKELNADSVAGKLTTLQEHYPPEQFHATLNILGTHDTKRLLTELDGNQKLLAMAILWQMCAPGVPHIYYGDEAGMIGETDPMNRKPYPWGQENEQTLHLFRQLGALRSQYPVLNSGDWSIQAIDERVLCIERVKYESDGTVSNRAVLFLNTNPDQSESIQYQMQDWKVEVLTELYPVRTNHPLNNRILEIEIPAQSGKLIVQDSWARNDVDIRRAGILMPLSALPSEWGIGDLGASALSFLDFLSKAGQKVWQILPYTQVDEFHSPYRSGSSLAGNLLLVDPEDLANKGLLDQETLFVARDTEFDEQKVEYEKVWALKQKLLSMAYLRFRKEPEHYSVIVKEFRIFKETESYWLADHALYMALKREHPEKTWNQWETGLARRDEEVLRYYRNLLSEKIEEESFYQYLFFSQWDAMKKKAVELGIDILGDMPLYVAYDSTDVWCNQELFMLNDEGVESLVAGVPPDYFSETGQRWGNPIYDWEEHKRTDFNWWTSRIKSLSKRVDRIRIDHFRGLADYYEIPASEETAVKGEWKSGPGISFFEALEREVPGLDILAENLGYLSYAANELKERLGYPGMLILQHLGEGYYDEKPLPQLYQRKEILYPGTHDDDTLKGYLEKQSTLPQGMNLDGFSLRTIWRLYLSDIELVMVPMQDHLLLGSDARFNRPGVAVGNWVWRTTSEQLSDELARRLKDWVFESKRGS